MLDPSSFCRSPCVEACYRCPVPTIVLANVAVAAIVASTLHLLVVRPTATAFFASLTAEQRRLRWQARMH